jgi:hypothetical protein
VQELLDLTRVHVLAAADHHVLDAPDDCAVPVVPHDGQISGVHPAFFVDGLAGPLLVAPVAKHHRVTAGAELAGLTTFHERVGVGVDDLDLDMRMHPPDRGGSTLQVVVDQCLARHR